MGKHIKMCLCNAEANPSFKIITTKLRKKRKDTKGGEIANVSI